MNNYQDKKSESNASLWRQTSLGISLGGFLIGSLVLVLELPSLAQIVKVDSFTPTNQPSRSKQVQPEPSPEPPLPDAPFETVPTAPDAGTELPDPTNVPPSSDRLHPSPSPTTPPFNPNIPSPKPKPLPPNSSPDPTPDSGLELPEPTQPDASSPKSPVGL